MTTQNISFANKLSIAFILILMGLCTSIFTSFILAERTIKDADLAIMKLQRANTFAQIEKDHIIWRENLTAWLAFGAEGAIPVPTDPNKCRFGQWYTKDQQSTTKELLPSTVVLLEELKVVHEQLHTSALVIQDFIVKGDRLQADKYYNDVTLPTSLTVLGLLEEIKNIAAASAYKNNQNFHFDKDLSLILNAIVFLIALVLTLVLWVGFKRSMIIPMDYLVDCATRISQGDLGLRTQLERGDELGMLSLAIDNMTDSLKAKISQVESRAEQTRLSAKQVSLSLLEADQRGATITFMLETLRDVSDQSLGLAHDLVEGSVSVTDSITGANNDVNDTVNRVKIGSGVMEDSLNAIALVEKITYRLTDNMEHLSAKAVAIGMVMNLISDIADQTNLLALNAAIEAARAGESGRGFAVVADEVRKLAEKTMKATHDVGDSIGAIQSEIKESVNNMKEAVGAVGKSTSLVKESRSTLDNILELATSNACKINDIATITDKQSSTCNEVSSNLESMKSISKSVNEEMDDVMELVQSIAGLTDELSSKMEDNN